MLFNSLTFFAFIALFLPVFFLARGRIRLLWTLGASYAFYGWWDWRFLFLIGTSTLFDYAIGRWLDVTEEPGRRRMLVYTSIIVNLAILGFFKYFNFFASSLESLATSLGITLSWTTLNIILPVGISFYTFQGLSYTIDVYRRRCPTERSLLRYATFVALFPQLVAGPIVRAADLLPQLHRDLPFDWQRARYAIELIAWGFFLKLVLADTIGFQMRSDPWFENPERFSGIGNMLGVLLFSFQIYGDFAGYSLIAIGLGHLMGYEFGINFRRPYFAASFSEFWQRWHISLSSWLRDYLYIPLGGNRGGRRQTQRNLLITMILGGLWHGAAWTFVIWGTLHGLYLIVSHTVERRVRALPPALRSRLRPLRFLAIAIVFILTALAWIFFRAPSLDHAVTMLARIVTLADPGMAVSLDKIGLVKCLIAVALVIAADAGMEHSRIRSTYLASGLWRAAGLMAILWGIALLGTFSGTEFIYFQF